MPLYKAIPALATGNTIIIKPSEDTSLVALRLGAIFQEAGFPEGVFNVVTGLGRTVGAAFANHDFVDKITFTGSTEVGRELVRASGGLRKKCSLNWVANHPTSSLPTLTWKRRPACLWGSSFARGKFALPVRDCLWSEQFTMSSSLNLPTWHQCETRPRFRCTDQDGARLFPKHSSNACSVTSTLERLRRPAHLRR